MIYLEPPEDFKPKFYVVSCFIEHDGKFLMLLRNDDKSEGNKWGLPAGKRDPGESEADALIREVQEESGIVLDPAKLDASLVTYVRYPDYDFVFHMFRSVIDYRPRVVISPREHKDFCWVTIEEFQRMNVVMGGQTHLKLFYGLS